MQRLLYISESRIDHLDADSFETEVVEAARIKNAVLGLSGALLFTGTHFAQILEGPKTALNAMMHTLQTDDRHENITVIERSAINTRRFADWQMAYFGPSQFVSRHVTRLLNSASPSEQQRASDWLIDLAHEFRL
jgi:hypothetical protein